MFQCVNDAMLSLNLLSYAFFRHSRESVSERCECTWMSSPGHDVSKHMRPTRLAGGGTFGRALARETMHRFQTLGGVLAFKSSKVFRVFSSLSSVLLGERTTFRFIIDPRTNATNVNSHYQYGVGKERERWLRGWKKRNARSLTTRNNRMSAMSGRGKYGGGKGGVDEGEEGQKERMMADEGEMEEEKQE